MARRRSKRRSRGRSRRGRSGGGSIFGMFRMVKSWRFWAMFAVAGTLLAAFYDKPLQWLNEAGSKVKGMVSKP